MKRVIGSLLAVALLVSVVGCASFRTPLPVDHEARATGIESQTTDY